jgi:hypothetical protein
MPAKRGLRVASEGDAPVKPKTLIEAVEGGTYLEILIAQQREIADKVRDERGPAAAALHRHLSLLSKEIAELRMTEDEDHSVVVNANDESWDGTGY